jgi:hypothetical protein
MKSSSYGFRMEAIFFIATLDWFDTHMRFSANPVFVKIAFDAFVPRSYTTVVLTATLVGLQDARRQETVAL